MQNLPMTQDDHLLNPAMFGFIGARRSKLAFVPGGDPSMGGGGDPSQQGGDPAAAGGDPAAAAGGGGAPAGPDPTVAMLQQQMQQMQQQMAAGGGGGGMGAGAGAGKNALTPKIDEKAVMLQILKILARIADGLKIPIPASEMVVNQTDMMGLAQASSSGGPMPGMDPTVGGGGGAAAGGGGAIGGIPPMQGSGVPGQDKQGSYRERGHAFNTDGLSAVVNKAQALINFRTRQAA